MPDPRPSNRRFGRAAIVVAVLVAVIVVTIFVTFNITHYRTMENQVQAENGSTALPDQPRS